METKKILIIDEERWYLEAVFDRIDYEYGKNKYDYCVTGSEAIELLQRNNYSVIILDMMLPLGAIKLNDDDDKNEIFGIIILKRIRELQGLSKTPILCNTVMDNADVIKKIHKYNANYVHKLSEDGFDKLFEYINKYI